MKLIGKILLFIFTCCKLTGQTTSWPVYRGTPDLTGRSDYEISSEPKLLWSLPTGNRTKSSPVISEGLIYFGNDKGTLYAITSDGKIKWKLDGQSPIEAPPLISGNKVIFGSSDGVMRAADKISGKLLWSYKTENQIAGSANVWKSGNKSGVIVGSYDYCLHCVNPESGKQMWKIETGNFINGAPAVSGNKIVLADVTVY